MGTTKVELLAPAGGPESGYAALHYGADAVYLGLERFSARAEAVNFTPGNLAEFAAYAHSRAPRRKIYLALNTLVKEDELAAAIETLLAAGEAGIDAVITQDLGMAALVRRRFPFLELHASTQMAIHNLDGAKAVRDLGFTRVTMARELTLGEIETIVAHSGLEVEAFIHGALCYSYSGLCLFSSLCAGRSGNRGRCAYPCREAVRIGGDPEWKHVFSLKDFALGPRVRELAAAGVASFKIEGRKKNPLYVAATVDYYRRILDGNLRPDDLFAAEAALQTVFSRPWTDFFLDGARNPDVADLDVVGHRGAPLGRVEAVRPAGGALEVLFTAKLGVELHDGIQIDIPGRSKPYGFPVDLLKNEEAGLWRRVFAVPPGARAAAALPPDAPHPEVGYRLYLASSQAVKRAFPYDVPKPGSFSPRMPLALSVSFEKKKSGCRAPEDETSCVVAAECRTVLPEIYRAAARVEEADDAVSVAARNEAVRPAFPARDLPGAERIARESFERLGGSGYRAASWSFDNPAEMYVKPGALNAFRRDLLADLNRKVNMRRQELSAAFADAAVRIDRRSAPSSKEDRTMWGVCVDSIGYLDEFTAADFADADEVAVGLGGLPPATCDAALDRLARRCGREKIRLLAPLISRFDKGKMIGLEMTRLADMGWRRWLVQNLWSWRLLGATPALDLVADWSLNVLNHASVEFFRDLGFVGVTLSPEDDGANLAAVLGAGGDGEPVLWVLVYGDVPHFVSAVCVHAHLGLCNSASKKDDKNSIMACGAENLRLTTQAGWKGEIIATGCGSAVIGDTPYSILDQVKELAGNGANCFRMDFRWRRYEPGEVVALWRQARASGTLRGHRGNYLRGLS